MVRELGGDCGEKVENHLTITPHPHGGPAISTIKILGNGAQSGQKSAKIGQIFTDSVTFLPQYEPGFHLPKVQDQCIISIYCSIGPLAHVG